VLIGGGDDVDRVRGDEVNGKANLDKWCPHPSRGEDGEIGAGARSKAQVMKV
jgi:hypothetical protein